MLDRYCNLDFIYETWSASQLQALCGSALDEENEEIINNFTPTTSVEFGYKAKLWS